MIILTMFSYAALPTCFKVTKLTGKLSWYMLPLDMTIKIYLFCGFIVALIKSKTYPFMFAFLVWN